MCPFSQGQKSRLLLLFYEEFVLLPDCCALLHGVFVSYNIASLCHPGTDLFVALLRRQSIDRHLQPACLWSSAPTVVRIYCMEGQPGIFYSLVYAWGMFTCHYPVQKTMGLSAIYYVQFVLTGHVVCGFFNLLHVAEMPSHLKVSPSNIFLFFRQNILLVPCLDPSLLPPPLLTWTSCNVTP